MNQSRLTWRTARSLAAGTLALCLAATTATANPNSGPDPAPQPTGQAPDRPQRPADGRADRRPIRPFLEKRLAEFREAQTAAEQALKMLDEGKSPEEVRKFLAEHAPAGRRGMLDLGADGERGDHPPPGPGGDLFGEPGTSPGGPPTDHPLTADEREAVRDILQATFPEMVARFDELMKKDPEAAERRFKQMVPRVRFLLDLRKNDEPLFKMRLEEIRTTREAVESAAKIAGYERAGAKDEDEELIRERRHLHSLVATQMEIRTSVLAHELMQLQERVDRLKKEIGERADSSDEAVNRQVEAILQKARQAPSKRGDGPGPGAERRQEHRPPDPSRPK